MTTAFKALVDSQLSALVRRTIPEAEAWRLCPEHGPSCGGPDCCCVDRHAGR